MKRFLSIITAVSIFLFCLAPAVYAASEHEKGVTEVLGIVSEGSEREFVTRSEVLATILKALKQDVSVYVAEPVFSDVTVEHKYFGSIMYAAEKGIISGAEDGRFYPDDYATAYETAVMMINAMGYKQMARGMGYTAFAADIGLFDGAGGDTFAPVTGKRFSDMIANMLFAVHPETVYTTGGTELKKSGETFLEQIWGLEKARGTVETTEAMSLTLEYGEKDKITVGGIKYGCARVDAEQYFGMEVTLYYMTEDGERDIYFIAPTSKNRVSAYKGEDFGGISSGEISFYNESDRQVRYTLTSAATLMLNGRVMKSADFAKKVGKNTEGFTIIDSDGNGTADVVMATEPKIYYNGIINVKDGVLGDEDAENIDLLKYRGYVIEDADGKRMELEKLTSDFHYLIYDPEDTGSVIRVIAVNLFLEGKVANVNKARGEVALEIGDKYKLLAGAKVTADDFEIGKTYKIWFNCSNMIIDAEETTGDGTVGAYLMGAKNEELGTATLKLLYENGKIINSELASRVTFRDTAGSKNRIPAAEAYGKLLKDGSKEVMPQLLFVKVNSEDKITAITQICENSDEPYHIQEYTKLTDPGRMRRWLSSAQSFQNEIQLKASTKVFVVPDRQIAKQDDKYYQVKSTSIFANDSNYAINEADGLLEGRYTSVPVIVKPGELAADYFVIECPPNTGFSDGGSMVYGIVTEFNNYYDAASEETVKQITIINHVNGQEVSYAVNADKDDVFDRDGHKIERGDFVQVTPSGGTLDEKNLLIYYDQSESKFYFVTAFDKNTGFSNEIGYRYYTTRLATGKVEDIVGNIAKCSVMESDPTKRHIEYINYSRCKVYKFPINDNKYEALEYRYLKKGDEFFAVMNNGVFNMIMNYE